MPTKKAATVSTSTRRTSVDRDSVEINFRSNAHILTEDIRTIAEAAREIPTRPCFATVWRWTTRGVKGRKLETYKVGSRVVTSTQAIHRFLEAIQ